MIDVDGIDYSPEGINALRDDLIVYRNRALDAMPEGAQMAVVLTHAIALLARLAELQSARKKPEPIVGFDPNFTWEEHERRNPDSTDFHH